MQVISQSSSYRGRLNALFIIFLTSMMAESREKKKTSRIPSIGKGQTPLYKHTLIILSSINKCLNGINVQYALRVHPLRNINHSRNAGSVMGHQVKTTIMIHSATLWISCVNLESRIEDLFGSLKSEISCLRCELNEEIDSLCMYRTKNTRTALTLSDMISARMS